MGILRHKKLFGIEFVFGQISYSKNRTIVGYSVNWFSPDQMERQISLFGLLIRFFYDAKPIVTKTNNPT